MPNTIPALLAAFLALPAAGASLPASPSAGPTARAAQEDERRPLSERRAERAKTKRPRLAVELSEPVVAIPFDHADGHVNLPVRIAGEGPFDFHFDTYCGQPATIDDDLASALDLPVIGKLPNSDGHQIVMREVVWIDELTFGGVTLRNVAALVDDYDYIETKNGTLRGLVGFPALRKHLLTFDYPANELRITTGVLDPDGEGTLPFTTATACPDIRLEIEGTEVLVGLDTGSDAGLLLDLTFAAEWELEDQLEPAGQARLVYTSIELLSGRLPAPVDLAGHDLGPIEALFIPFPEPRGLLGHEVFRDFALTFDGRRRLVRFERAPRPVAAPSRDDPAAAGE